MLVASLSATWTMQRIDGRVIISGAMIVLAVSYFWRAHFASNVTMGMVILANVLLGFSMPTFAMPTMAIGLAALRPQDNASANGAIAFARTIAIAFATSLIATRWRDDATINRPALVGRLDGPRAMAEIGTAGLPPEQALRAMDQIVDSQAVMMATNDVYLILATLVAVLALLVWIAPGLGGRALARKHRGH
jgi:DHA2 family multidrug resistance protein